MHNTNRLVKEDEIAMVILNKINVRFSFVGNKITASAKTRVLPRNANWPTWPTAQ